MSFELIVGPMFSGKTEELIRRLDEAGAAGLRVAAAKPSVDAADPGWIVSLSGARRRAVSLPSVSDLVALAHGRDVLGIDEIEFFEPEIVGAVAELASTLRIVAAGLDLVFRGEPFAPMPALAELADELAVLTASCAVCGGVATRSQRLLDGRPAPRDAPTIQIGGRELYEPRCEQHHLVPVGGTAGSPHEPTSP
jgi:thymidine kinase